MSVRFVKSSVSAYGMAPADENRALRLVELCGRTAYKSEDKITEPVAQRFEHHFKGDRRGPAPGRRSRVFFDL